MNELVESIVNLKRSFKTSDVETVVINLSKSSSSASVDGVEVLGIGKRHPTNRDILDSLSNEDFAEFIKRFKGCDHPDIHELSTLNGESYCSECFTKWLSAPYVG